MQRGILATSAVLLIFVLPVGTIATAQTATPSTTASTGDSLAVRPTKVDFNFARIGSSTSVLVNLTNLTEKTLSITANVLPSSIGQTSGDFRAFASDCSRLLPRATCTAQIEFAPRETGPGRVSIELVDKASGVKTYIPSAGLGFIGSGPGPWFLPDPTPSRRQDSAAIENVNFTATPMKIEFNSVPIGSPSSRLVNLTNRSETNLSITANVLPSTRGQNSGNFTVSDGDCKTLPPSSICTLQVEFAPKKTGPGRASIELVDSTGAKTYISTEGIGFETSVNPWFLPDPTPKQDTTPSKDRSPLGLDLTQPTSPASTNRIATRRSWESNGVIFRRACPTCATSLLQIL